MQPQVTLENHYPGGPDDPRPNWLLLAAALTVAGLLALIVRAL